MKIWLLSFSLFVSFVMYAESPKTEIRAVWLTTIYGLDWPSREAKTEAEYKRQQKELIDILDRLQEANFNMVFLQVRLRGDVIYRSEIEPASKVFSGRYGTRPSYDPLAFAIEECHKRGMECHAWFVTFPVGTNRMVREQGDASIVKRHPEYCRFHNGEWYIDPGVPEARDYIRSLARELVEAYDIDGLHLDYVRYPDKADTFPDRPTFRKYGNNKSRDQWRRDNVTALVTDIHDDIKQIKPWVQFSSAPLGKYSRIPRVPNAGWTAYETVFQDAQKWMELGKQDMIAPMMYYLDDDFFPFVDNWVENANGRHVIAGLGAYRLMRNEADWTLNDITDQIDYSRYFGMTGAAFFRAKNVLDNTKGIYDELKNNYYKYPAVLPPLTWLSDSVPSSPEEILVTREGNTLHLSWEAPEDAESVISYTVYYSRADTVSTQNAKNILVTGIRGTSFTLPVQKDEEQEYSFSITSSNKYRIESQPSRETYYYLSRYEK
jgi:Uncharacterized protein conserved in bacteria